MARHVERLRALLLAVTATTLVVGSRPGFAGELPEDRVVVTATRTRTDLTRVPQLVTIIDQEDLERRGVRTTPEALQEEVGILVQETNFGAGSPFLRGQTGNRVLVLVDGVRLNNSTFRLGPNQYLNTVDSQQIERIEIVRGPSSVLYGSDALGGVVHVMTKRRHHFDEGLDIGANTRAQFASAAFEKTGRAESSGNYGDFGFQTGLTFRDFEDLRSGTREQDHTGYDEIDGDARLQYRIGDRHELAVAVQRVRQERVPNTVAFTADRSAVFDPQERLLAMVEHDWRDLPWGFRHLHTTLSWHDQDEVRRTDNFNAATTTREEDEVGTIGFSSQLEYGLLDFHSLLGGVEVYHDRVDSRRMTANRVSGESRRERSAFPDDSEYDTLGVFLQATIEVGKALIPMNPKLDLPWTIIVGGRYSRFSIDSEPQGFDRIAQSFDDITTSVASTYDITEHLHLVGSAAEGFRAPSLEDTVVLREEPALGTIDSPNPNLKPEANTNYEIGLKTDWPGIEAGLAYFYSQYEDLIERQTVGFRDDNGNGMRDAGELSISQRRNVGEAEIRGVELWYSARLWRGLSTRGQASWIRGDNTTIDEPFRRIPPALGLAGLLYESERWDLWMEFFARVAGEQDRLSLGDKSDSRIPKGGTPGWHTLNLRGGWQPHERVDLNLAIENFTDQRYRTHGSGIDAPGVNVIASLGVRF